MWKGDYKSCLCLKIYHFQSFKRISWRFPSCEDCDNILIVPCFGHCVRYMFVMHWRLKILPVPVAEISQLQRRPAKAPSGTYLQI